MVCTGQKNAGIYGEKHLVRVQARICATGDHLVKITSASGAPWRSTLEREGRALTSPVHFGHSVHLSTVCGAPH